MTPEAQRIAIAEACGWTNVAPRIVKNVKHEGDDITVGIWSDNGWIPDYLNDLNAMHDAEQVLTPKYQPAKGESQWGEYLGWLGFCGENKTREVYECVTATASQRAEAFLRTIGKWKELK